jgi:hypothetical protein
MDKRYGKYSQILITFNGKQQEIWKKECAGYFMVSDPHELEKKAAREVKSPINLLCILLEMMILSFDYPELIKNLSHIVEKRKVSDTLTEIIVSAHPYTKDEIPGLISRMCGRHIYWNISPEDANEIITRLGLSQYVFCVQGDPASGACLVVLQELNFCYYELTHQEKKEPRTTFREEYGKFNQSRTVVMTPAQRNTILLDEMKPSVEFSSALPDGQIEVVFRREAIQTVVPEIKRLVEIDNLRRRLEELTSSK